MAGFINKMSADGPDKQMDYEKSKQLAKDADPSVRAKLASNKNLPPEVLYFLAEDEDVNVRLQVANNDSAPEMTHTILAGDKAENVRSHLAAKIARSLDAPENYVHEKAHQMSRDALARLAEDQIVAVRRALAEAIKDVLGAPADIILKMAGDPEAQVAGPILEYSPVLSEEELIRIIETPRSEGARNSISRRKGVNENISNAIVATDDVGAIGDLLGNKSAQIQEATLDKLIDRADEIELWHAPLISRPSLPNTAAVRLAHFVAENLLEELQQRDDIDKETMDDVKRVVQDRMDEAGFELENEADMPAVAQDFLSIDPPISMVQTLYEKRRLDGEMIKRSLDAGDYSFVLAALMVTCKIDIKIVQRIFADQNEKGIIALCLLSLLPVELIIKVQQRMGRVPPDAVLKPVNGEYPLSEKEADWQIEFYTNLIDRAPSPNERS